MEIFIKIIFGFIALLGIGSGLYAFHNYLNMLDSYQKQTKQHWVLSSLLGNIPFSKSNLSSDGLSYRKRSIKAFSVMAIAIVVGFLLIFITDTAAFNEMFKVFDHAENIKPNN